MTTRHSLKVRLTVMIGILAILSTLALSQIAAHFSRLQIKEDQSALLRQIVVSMASRLNQDIRIRSDEIVLLTALDQIRQRNVSPERKREVFEIVRKNYPMYAWIGMTDDKGTITAGTDDLLVGKSVAARDWFIKGRDGLFFGDVHDAFLLAKLVPKPKWDDLPLRLVDISAPVMDKDNKLLGVICGHLSLDWAFEVREQMLQNISSQGLDVVVLNKEGNVLMGNVSLPSLRVNLRDLNSFRSVSSETEKPAVVEDWPNGKSYLAVAAAVENWPDGKSYLTVAAANTSLKNFPTSGWTVVARKDKQIAFAPAERLAKTITVLGFITAGLFGIVMWVMIRRQLKPLEEVSAAAEHIHTVDLTTPIPKPKGDDEIATFARSLANVVSTLQKSNAELKLASRVFEESGQGIMITDAERRLLRVNRTFSDITGYTSEEALGKNPRFLQSGRHDLPFYQSMWESIKKEGVWRGEIWNKTKSGNLYPEWLTIGTLKDDKGNITHYIGIFDDITERKSALDALQMSEEKYRRIFETIQDVYIEIDPRGKILEISPSIQDIAGYRRNDLLKAEMLDSYTAPHWHSELLTQLQEGKAVNDYEFLLSNIEGKEIPCSFTGRLISNDDGSPEKIVGILRDITVRRESEKALQSSERFLNDVIESIQDGICVLNRDMTIRRVNGIMRQWYHDCLPLEGKICHICFHGSHEPLSHCPAMRCFETGETGREIAPGLPNSPIQWIEIFSYPLRDVTTGEVTGVVEFMRDITAIRKLEKQLLQTQKMESIGILAGGIAHDFNNILTVITGFSELMLSNLPKGSTAYESLSHILNAADRGSDLVRQILTFSRKSEQKKQHIMIHVIVKEALKLLRASIPTSILIDQHIDETSGIVFADPTQLHQIVMNLCTNAHQAITKGGGQHLVVSLRPIDVDENLAASHPDLVTGPYVQLQVKDDGSGMDEETMTHIFEPFFTTKSIGVGTGMGLAMVHGIVKGHGGAIDIQSIRGEGSTFTIYLPRIVDHEISALPDENAMPVAGSGSILYIDDEPDLVDLGRIMLESLGYHVTGESSSESALSLFQNSPDQYDLVITDQTMPHLSGVELAKKLLAIRPDIPIIVCSGYSDMLDSDRAKAMHIKAFVNKPFTMYTIAETIRKVLDESRQKRNKEDIHDI